VFFPSQPRDIGVAKGSFGSYITRAVLFGDYPGGCIPLEDSGEEIPMKSYKKIALFSLVVALAIPTVAAAQGSGADTFKAKCAMCHGADGSASTGMGKSMGLKPLSSPEVQGMSDADLIALITNGKGKMPAYKGKLSDAEISAVAKYVKTLK
jgi:mono/diheme cytochrome c family protein